MGLIKKGETKVKKISLVNIHQGKSQPRQIFSNNELMELSLSIRENGILQPISVRKDGINSYELIAGERRMRAAILAGLEEVPCIVVDCDDKQAAVFSLMENLQRVDLDPFEEALGISKLIKIWGITQEEAAKKLGKKQSTIANKLRLLKLDEEDIKMIKEAGLTERHARAMLKLKSGEVRKLALKQVIQKNLNVSQTEALVDKLSEHFMKIKEKTKPKLVVKDVRIFINTITKAVDTMRLSGIEASSAQNETDEYIECVVRIPKSVAIKKKKEKGIKEMKEALKIQEEKIVEKEEVALSVAT